MDSEVVAAEVASREAEDAVATTRATLSRVPRTQMASPSGRTHLEVDWINEISIYIKNDAILVTS